jgi:hypothetical protein
LNYWNNLADDPEHADAKRALKKWLPKNAKHFLGSKDRNPRPRAKAK